MLLLILCDFEASLIRFNTVKILRIFLVISGFLHFSNFAIAKSVDLHLQHHIAVEKRYISPPILFETPMDRAVLSWNTLSEAKLDFYLRVKNESRWSRWFHMGSWGPKPQDRRSFGKQNSAAGYVDIDTLFLKNPSGEWQYKIVTNRATTLDTIALSVRNSSLFSKKDDLKIDAKIIMLPSLSQFEESKKQSQEELARRICSPTSLAMVLKYKNVDVDSPLLIADKVFDAKAKMYGNWPLNTAVLYSMLKQNSKERDWITYVRWFDSFGNLLEHVQHKNPVIVSIGFKEGELEGAPIPTPGHLVVVRGADKNYVYVNDPAMESKGAVAKKYRRDQFVKAWKGVAYVISSRVDDTRPQRPSSPLPE